MKKMKKGLEFTVLVLLIVGLIGGVLLFYYLSSFLGGLERKTDIETCRLSILARAKITDVSASLSSTGISCPAEHVTVKYADQKKTAGEIARQMRNCWYKMGEGAVRVFGRDWTQAVSSCFICSEFSLTTSIDITVVKEYLTYKIPNIGQTYLDYFAVLNQPLAPTPDIFFITAREEGIAPPTYVASPLTALEKETPYVILFVHQRPSVIQAFFSPLSAVASVLGPLVGKEAIEEAQTFFVIPRDNIAKLSSGSNQICQELYWEKGKEYEKE